MGRLYGSVSGRTDALAITDENGEFIVYCTNGISSIIATVDARGLAKRRMWLETGTAHLIRMKKGVTVAGRLLRDKEPLAGVKVAMNTQDRESSVFMRGWEVATDKEGRFMLSNIPASMQFNLYTRMKDMSRLGVGLSTQLISTGPDETTLKIGDLAAKPAHKIKGRIVLSDGQPVPLQTQVYLGLENGYDSQNLTVNEDGASEFGGVPPSKSSSQFGCAITASPQKTPTGIG